jgi:hypothetical protein
MQSSLSRTIMQQRIALYRRTGTPGWLVRAGVAAALAALVLATWRVEAAHRARRRATQPAALPEPLQVWEDEGGQNQMPDAPPERPEEAMVSPG